MTTARYPLQRTPIAMALMVALSLTASAVPAAPALRPEWPKGIDAHSRLTSEIQQAVIDRQAHRPGAAEIQARVDAWRARSMRPHGGALSAIALAKTLPETAGAEHVVANCNDAGNGSLRHAVAGAASGDTIDLSELTCSTITLTTGTIAIAQNDLTLNGPGVDELTISGGNQTRVLTHAAGTLRINDLTLADGHKYSTTGQAEGGCIRSSGSVVLNGVEIRDCLVQSSANAPVRGGGVYAAGTITVIDSVIRSNGAANKYAESSSIAVASGGGLQSGDRVHLYNSLVIDNQTYAFGINPSEGGGVDVANGGSFFSKYSQIEGNAAHTGGGISANVDAFIVGSTIAGNQAIFNGGGYIGNGNVPATVLNSTISGNTAEQTCAGLKLGNGTNLIANSTITGNSAGISKAGVCGGIAASALRLESTIIAGNLAIGSPSDLSDGSGPIAGSHNLIFTVTAGSPPSDTITGTDPQLEPLADNGGQTLTHGLSSNSPAIDAGNNAEGVDHDQRGEGFPRVTSAAADIGAYEFDDLIFAHDFELPH